jgi:hypothetical protein
MLFCVCDAKSHLLSAKPGDKTLISQSRYSTIGSKAPRTMKAVFPQFSVLLLPSVTAEHFDEPIPI